MALARVQATAKVTSSNTATVAIPFTTPPALGSAVIVLVNFWRSPGPGPVPNTCTDTRGNTYTLATFQHYSGQAAVTGIFCCPSVTATGAPFTITVTHTSGAGAYWVAQAVEYSGVGAGLVLDRVAGAFGSSSTPATGATAALTGADVVQAASMAIQQSHSFITVGAATPTWTQEFEELASTNIAGEANTRLVSGATGTTPSCGWTTSAVWPWAAAIAVFKVPAALSAAEQVQTFLVLPV